jgi:hypothetical protein
MKSQTRRADCQWHAAVRVGKLHANTPSADTHGNDHADRLFIEPVQGLLRGRYRLSDRGQSNRLSLTQSGGPGWYPMLGPGILGNRKVACE